MQQQIVLCDGKYVVVLDNDPDNFRFEALMGGKKWRDLVGDGLVLSMFQRILELEHLLEKAKE